MDQESFEDFKEQIHIIGISKPCRTCNWTPFGIQHFKPLKINNVEYRVEIIAMVKSEVTHIDEEFFVGVAESRCPICDTKFGGGVTSWRKTKMTPDARERFIKCQK